MGSAITELLEKKELLITDLKGKVLAIDAFNILYQFLTTIRTRDGSPLRDSRGDITSHLNGLFSRTTKLMMKGLKPVFVFDGEPPELKEKERKRRAEKKKKAEKKYQEAKAEGDKEKMRKYAGRTSKLTEKMVDESKELLKALGLPVVQAPSEGEAQAAHMVKKKDCYAVISQDADALLFGAPRVIRNLNIEGRRKKINSVTYKKTVPQLIKLKKTLNKQGINREQLIILAMLIGTDYNKKGIKGIGPKRGIKLVKKHGSDFDRLFEEAGWEETYDMEWNKIFYLFKNIPVTDDYELAFNKVEPDRVKGLLVEEHDFKEERVDKKLKKLIENQNLDQKGLNEYF